MKSKKTQLISLALFIFIASTIISFAIFLRGDLIKLGDISPLGSELHRWIAIAIVILTTIILEVYLYIKITRLDDSGDKKALSEEEEHKLYLDKFNKQQIQLAYKYKESNDFPKNHRSYKNPWFLLLGDNDGKTELFDELSMDAFHKTPSDNKKPLIQWSFTPTATLLAPNNSIWNHQDDLHRSLWLHFNNWILEKRSKRPINGVILNLSIEKLITSNNKEAPSISTVKTKLAALNSTYGNKVPVYIIVNQLNKLDGFEAFQSMLSDDQLKSPFGLSIASYQSNQDLDFDKRYKILEDTLNASLIRHSSTSDYDKNQQAYLFTRQFAGLKQIFSNLANSFTENEMGANNLSIRGIYFMATKTSDRSLLHAITSTVNKTYDLASKAPQTLSGKTQTQTSYFSQQLLKAVFLPESGITGDNIHHIRKRRKKIFTTYALTGSIIALFCATWLYFYQKNQHTINQYADLIQGYQTVQQPKANEQVAQSLHLETLDLLHAAIVRNQEKHYTPLTLRDMGEEQAYRRILGHDFLPALIEQQVDQLENRVENNKRVTLNAKNIEQLKVIRLLNIDTSQITTVQKNEVDKYRKQRVLPWMEAYWKQHYENYNQIEASLKQHLSYALDNNIQSKNNVKIEQRITTLQSHEQALPIDEKIYQQIKQQVETNYPIPLRLRHQLGVNFSQVFEHVADDVALTIPYLYTQQGFTAYKTIDYRPLLQALSLDAWALGEHAHLQNYSDQDILQLKKQVKEHYVSDYEVTWLTAINTLKVRNFHTPQEALIFLNTLTGKDSPYKKLLLQVRENTLLPIPEATSVAEDKGKQDAVTKNLATLSDEQKIEKDIALSLKASFGFINELSEKDDSGKSYMDGIFKTLVAIQKNMKNSVTPQKKSAAPSEKTEENPVEILLDISSTVEDPFQSQLGQIALNTQALVSQRMTTDINQDWQQTVYSFYTQKLKGKYPLAKSKQAVSLDDFKAFFGKEGILDQFYNKHLSSIFGDKPDSTTFDQPSPILETYQHATFIQDAFFNEAGEYQVEFTIEPTELSNIFINAILNLEGTKIPYQHEETKPLSLVWPIQSKNQHKSSLTLNPIEKNVKNTYLALEGEWAFFHLMDTSKTHALKDRERHIRFIQGGGLVGYKLTVPKSVSPLTKDVFAGFDIPPTLHLPTP